MRNSHRKFKDNVCDSGKTGYVRTTITLDVKLEERVWVLSRFGDLRSSMSAIIENALVSYLESEVISDDLEKAYKKWTKNE